MMKTPFRFGLSGVLLVSGLLFASVVLAAIVVGSSTTNVSNDVVSTQVKLTQPSNTAVGDFLLANLAIKGGTGAGITVPSGWTLIERTDNDTDVTIASYWAIATSSGAAFDTWTINPSTRAVGGMTRFTGIDTTNPVDAMASSTGFGTYATTTSVTTTRNGDQILTIYATDYGKDSTVNFATSTGTTKEYDAQNTPFGPTTSFQDLAQTSAGTTATASSTFSAGKNREWAAQTIALQVPGISIALDNKATGSSNSTSSSVSLTATSSTLIIVGCEDQFTTGSSVTATWAGNAMTQDAQAINTNDDVSTLFSYYNTTGQTANAVCNAPSDSYVSTMVTSFTGAKNAHAFATDTGHWSDAETSKTSTIDASGHTNAMHIAVSYAGTGQTAGSGTQVLQIVGNARAMWASNPYSIAPAGSNSISITFSASGGSYAAGAYDAAP